MEFPEFTQYIISNIELQLLLQLIHCSIVQLNINISVVMVIVHS